MPVCNRNVQGFAVNPAGSFSGCLFSSFVISFNQFTLVKGNGKSSSTKERGFPFLGIFDNIKYHPRRSI